MNVSCPNCKETYDASKLIPKTSKVATIICSKCGTHFDVVPGRYLNWWWPNIRERLNVIARDKGKK